MAQKQRYLVYKYTENALKAVGQADASSAREARKKVAERKGLTGNFFVITMTGLQRGTQHYPKYLNRYRRR